MTGDFSNLTPLADVAAYGTTNDQKCAEVAAILLGHGAAVDPLDDYKDTPLLHAVESEKTRLARVLLEHGASLKATYAGAHSGMTPLHMAVMNGNKEMVRVLLEFKPPLDAEDRNEATPLLLAEQKNKTEIAAMLRQADPEPSQGAPGTNAIPPTREAMNALAQRFANGEARAYDELVNLAETLYHGIDYQKERARVVLNLDRTRTAFNVLGKEAGVGNMRTFNALTNALGVRYLSSFAPEALGVAAAAGNKEALAVLLNNDRWGIAQMTVNYALCLPAQGNIEPAVDYFVTWLKSDKPFKTGVGEVMSATNALAGAAALGNLKAKDALEQFVTARRAVNQIPQK